MSQVDITAYNDADFTYGFNYQKAGVAIDLTGASMVMKLRRVASSVQADLELTTANGGIRIASPATAGNFSLFVTEEQLQRLDTADYAHSLIMTRVDGVRVPIWHGTFTVKAGASR